MVYSHMLVGLYLTSQAQAVTNTVPVVKQEPALLTWELLLAGRALIRRPKAPSRYIAMLVCEGV
jgi:hypothetical protein